MNKIYCTLCLIIAVAFSIGKSNAQTTVVVGTGTASSLYGPIYIFSSASTNVNSWNLSIYDQSEIINAGGSSGTITKISWNKTTSGAYIPSDASFEIFIKHVSQTSFATGADFDVEVVGATLVYSNTAESLPATIGWIDYQLTNPFSWNGTDNIMILTRWQRVTAGTDPVEWESTNFPTPVKTSHSFNTSPAMGTLYTTGNRPNVTLEFGAVGPDDAGVVAIDSTFGHCIPGSYPVYAKVKNFGTDILNSFTLNWSLDGIVQTPIIYTTPAIAPNSTTEVFLTNLNFNSTSNYEIVAYPTLPNGFPDNNNRNDTISVKNIRSSLSGNYTIGGVNPDFATLAEACSSLKFSGICSPVEFNLRNGTYTEQVVLSAINGSSSTNTVTFKSESNDSSQVIITWPSSATNGSNYTLKVSNVANVIFKNLTFERSGAELFSNIIDLSTTSNCTFTNNRFIGPIGNNTTNTAGTRSGIFAADKAINNDLHILNNYFKDNGNGIWLNGSSTQITNGIIIDRNIFETFYVGAFLLYHYSPIISNNSIKRNDLVSTIDYFGISLRYCTGYARIFKNKITCNLGNYGIRLRQCTSTVGSEGMTFNNFIQVGGTAISRGISIEDNSTLQKIYHNSINCKGTSTTQGSALYVAGATSTGIYVYNNILANTAGGYGYYVAANSLAAVSASDNNDIYSSGLNIAFWGLDRANLFALSASSSKDNASVSSNPLFNSATDLHTSVANLSHHGSALAGIAEDIDGEPRNGFTPDIGADEFTAVGIKTNTIKFPLSIYPNPVSDFCTIKADGLVDGKEMNLQISDITGRIVYTTVIKNNTGANEIKLDVHQLSKGSYFIDCLSSDKRYHSTFIKL